MNKLLISGPVKEKFADGVVLHTQNPDNSVNEFFVPWNILGEQAKKEITESMVSIVDLEATVTTNKEGGFGLQISRSTVINYRDDRPQIVLPEALN